jgi:hypothetical protein
MALESSMKIKSSSSAQYFLWRLSAHFFDGACSAFRFFFIKRNERFKRLLFRKKQKNK